MQTRSFVFGTIGFLLGVMAVSFVACRASSQQTQPAQSTTAAKHEVLMSEMTTSLKDKKGDEYDALFIAHMIEHHQAAVDMSRLSEQNAKHDEIKQLSRDIIAAQEKEIAQMRAWQKQWGYSESSSGHAGH